MPSPRAWLRVVVPVLLLVTPTSAQDPDVTTLTGTLVDVMCYGRIPADALGSRHAECALKCATGGVDVALVTSDGPVVIVGRAVRRPELQALLTKRVAATGVVRAGNEGPTLEVSFTAAVEDDPDTDEDETVAAVPMIEDIGEARSEPGPSAADR